MEKDKVLDKRIDFVVLVDVDGANPNGDPINSNLPRVNSEGYGLMSDVSIKRKLRNRFQDYGERTLYVSADRIEDGIESIEGRINEDEDIKKVVIAKKGKLADKRDALCNGFFDVKAFGAVLAFGEMSIGIRGAVNIQNAVSVDKLKVERIGITKSLNGGAKDDGKIGSDRMGGMKYLVKNKYIFFGSINPYFAEKNGFTYGDVERVKESLLSLFVNDESSARPAGSMQVKELHWIEHDSKLGSCSTGKLHQSTTWDKETEKIVIDESLGLEVEVIKGF